MRRLVLFVTMFLFFSAGIANAQTECDFVSESTGSDGAFDPAVSTMLIVPPDGVFNFTTINIRTGVTVTFQKNAANTPVYMLATENVTINGTIDVSGRSAAYYGPIVGVGGPGGFAGGYGGGQGQRGGNGLGLGGGEGGNNTGSTYWDAAGPGGYGTAGQTPYTGGGAGAGGIIYGNARIIPLIGGSGGGGTGWFNHSYGGGGGGGAILIASSKTIVINGSITANGGNSGDTDRAGGGSGGAIKLMADAISGGGTIMARGGSRGGGVGRIRLEACANSFNASDPQFTYGLPGSVFVANSLSLNITTIGGIAVPASSKGSYAQPDLLLPSATTNPVSVEIAASNIPVNTTVIISATPQYGAASSATAVLTGADASSTAASASVNVSTQYTNVITATTTFTIQAMYWNGEKIETAEVSTTPGEKSTVTYISKSGKKIKEETLILAGLVRK